MKDNIIASHIELIENNIMSFVPTAHNNYKIIEDAMRYSLEAGGKRVRPVLALEFCRVLGGDVNNALPLAAAVEFIHTYSLIHDDLPCMDNDDFRRGKPSSHKKFGEAYALLAGDALLTHAFSCITKAENLSAMQRIEAVKYLAEYAGANGMIGGQVIDLLGEGKNLELPMLFHMDQLKTSALIKVSCVLGCIAANRFDCIDKATEFAENLGIAFQIIDDILDFLEGETNSDIVSGKSTYVSLLGIDGAKTKAAEYTEASINALNAIDGDTSVLEEFANILLSRKG